MDCINEVIIEVIVVFSISLIGYVCNRYIQYFLNEEE